MGYSFYSHASMVIIPIRSFNDAKQRLSSVLDAHGRASLARRLAEHVTQKVLQADAEPLVVTADDEVSDWAEQANLATVPDPGEGLNAAAAAGMAHALEHGRPWVILHGDLAWLGKEDVTTLIEALAAGHEPIAPSSDGGTSALGASRQVELSYGPGSFHRHLARLAAPRVVARRGLLLDIDTPLDLSASRWVEHHG